MRELHRAAQRRHRFGRMAAFQQRLALELVEIRIVRLRLDQLVDQRERAAQIGMAVGRDGARVARRQAVVAERVAARDRVGPVEEAGQLRPHHVVTQLQLGRILAVPIGARLGDRGERGDAFGRHRMGLQIGIDVARIEQRFVGQALEQFDHALRRLAGGVEEFHAGMVGLVFLRAHIGEQRALDRRLRRHDRRHADIAAAAAGARARHHGADAEQHGDDRRGLRRGELLAQLHQMAAGQVAGFVREHADDLVRRLGVEQRAGIDEDVAAVHDEGVERAVAEHDHPDVLLGEAGGAQDRLRVVAQQLLDLGVADHRHAAQRRFLGARRANRGGDAGGRDRESGQQRERAALLAPSLRPDRCAVFDHADLPPNGWART